VLFITILIVTLSAKLELNFRRFGKNEGMSELLVDNIYQCSQGFIWLGSGDGLYRFDGYEFAVYSHDPEEPTSLSAHDINFIKENQQGELWIGTASSIDRFNRTSQNVTRFKPKSMGTGSLTLSANGTKDWLITHSFLDRNGNFWAQYNDSGIYRIDGKTFEMKLFGCEGINPENRIDKEITCLNDDSRGNVLIGCADGTIIFLDKHSGNIRQLYKNPDSKQPVSNSEIRRIIEDDDRSYWIASYGDGLIHYRTADSTVHYYRNTPTDSLSIPTNHLFTLCNIGQGRLAMGGEKCGLVLFDKKHKVFDSYKNNEFNPKSISNNIVRSIYNDTQGNLWIGNFQQGINFVQSLTNKKFTHVRKLTGKNTLSKSSIPAIMEDKKGNFWIGTDGGGLNHYDRQTGTYTHYTHNPADKTTIRSNAVLAVYESTDGNIWVGGWNGGTSLFNEKDGTFEHFDYAPTYAHPNARSNVFTIIGDRNGMLYIATHFGGLHVFNTTTRTFLPRYSMISESQSHKLPSDDLYTVILDDQKNLWIGGIKGVNVVNRKNNTNQLYDAETLDSTSLSNTVIRSLFKDSKGVVWLGTESGLNKAVEYEPHQERFYFKHYLSDRGTAANCMECIEEDRHGHLWIGTRDGLCRFNPETESFRYYSVDDGLQGPVFSLEASCKTRSGEMLFGGTKGYNIFHPDSVRDDQMLPKVAFTEFSLFNTPVAIGDTIDKRVILPIFINETNEITLSYKDDVFSITFAGLHFTTPEKNKYAYRMVGFDKQWNYKSAQHRFATYTNLDAGTYSFQVKAANSDGVWTTTEMVDGVQKEKNNIKTLTIHITPAWWTTWWFKTSVVLFIISSVALGVYLRIRAIKENERKLEEKLTERTSELVEMQKKALVNAHKAGKADVATEIVHNAGNVLNSIVTSLQLVKEVQGQKNLEQLKRAMDLLRKNRGNLSHFFTNNPKGEALVDYLLEVTELLDEDQSNYANHTDRISEQVETILDLIKAEQENLGDSKFDEETDIPRLLDQVLLFNEHIFQKNKITIEKTFQLNEPVITQQIKLSQVINNLMSNALDALDETPPSQGKITLGCEKDKGTIRIFIADNGKGIEPQSIKKIFAHGFTTKAGHKGFGLHNTANFLTEMGGKIWAESDGEGKGSRFVIELKETV
jgi:ligand-binding sensor domain-containing protein/signal transduction histidine kinase